MKTKKFLLIGRTTKQSARFLLAMAAVLLAVVWVAKAVLTTKASGSASLGKPRKSSGNEALHRIPDMSGQKSGTRSNASLPGMVPASPVQPGMIVYVDPATGWIGNPPPGVVAALIGSNAAFSTSSSGLVQSNSPVVGGGVMVHLQGRFQNAMAANNGLEGRLSTTCGAALAELGAHQDGVQTNTAVQR